MSYETQRIMLDIWGRAIREDRYADGPQRPKCNLAEYMQMGIRVGPAKTGQEVDDETQTVEQVQRFMLALQRTNRLAHDCLWARHTGIWTDARGRTWKNHGFPEKHYAPSITGVSGQAGVMKFRRACDEGYAALMHFEMAA